ncbi:MAG: hypothetical protein M3Q27_09180, partial [Actinomycetota bacterium]|nr:hypothetical protein [Actinomycetota bacterium]
MKIAGRQHQVFSTAQALQCDIRERTLRDVARRLAIANLGEGLWACAGAPNTYRRKLSVAQLRFGDDVVFTARTALWLRQIITANPPVVDVLARPDAHYRARTRTRFHRGATIDGASTVK